MNFKKVIASCLTLAMAMMVLPTARVSASAVRMKPDGEAAYTNVIDVSHHETVTSWGALRQHTSVIYTKATEGTTYTDPTLDAWATGAEENGLDFGFFHYFWPGSLANARQQASFFVSAISKYSYSCLPVVDVEESNGYSAQAVTAAVEAFRAEVKAETGLNCMIYVSAGQIDRFFDPLPADAPLWIADYSSPFVDGPRSISAQVAGRMWAMWQYTDSAYWPGLASGVDANKATASIFIDKAKTSAGEITGAAPAPVFTGSLSVQRVQQKLNTIHIPRPALDEDGYTGPLTREGVRVMEQVCGLHVDSGVWGSQCQNAYDSITSQPTLKYGSRGMAVRYLQYRLGIQFDGQFGNQTEQGVEAFQRAHNLNADGIVGPATWAALMEA